MCRIVKKDSRFIIIIAVLLLLIVGCSDKQNGNNQAESTISTETNTQNNTYANENKDDSTFIQIEEETIPTELVTEMTVKIGVDEIKLEDVIMGYRNQDAYFVKPLSSEDLMKPNMTYDLELSYKGKSYIIKINTIDDEVPVISGVHDIYVYVGGSISYKKNISVTDNSGENLALSIDNSRVNINEVGIYPLYYEVVDSSGNKTIKGANVYVQPQPVIDEAYITPYCDRVIASVITADMSDYKKAHELWNWCRRNIAYSRAAGDRTSEWTGAYEGFVKKCGDCYTFYATYSVLLSRVGIENIKVSRIGGTSNHWWNLVKINGSWYHCDTSPRTKGDSYRCFMQTDEQIAEYTEKYTSEHPEHPNYYTFDKSLYPERGTEILYPN